MQAVKKKTRRMRSHRDLNSGGGIYILRDSGAVGRVGESFQARAEQPLGAIHSTKIPTGPGPLQKVDPFFRNFSGWTEPIQWVLDWNFLKFWLSGSRPLSSDFKQTISKRLSECWLLTGQKMLVLLCQVDNQHLPSSFRVFLHDGYCLAYLSGSFIEVMRAIRKGNFNFLIS